MKWIEKGNVSEKRFFTYIRHVLMRAYGWIPLKDFREMSYPELMSLYNEIKREIKNRPKPKSPKAPKGRR